MICVSLHLSHRLFTYCINCNLFCCKI